jgi:hypothetical protein
MSIRYGRRGLGKGGRILLAGLLVPLLAGAVPAAAQTPDTTAALPDTAAWVPPRRNFLLAAGEVFGVNLLVWTFNRYIREGGTNPGFRVGFESWSENIHNGFEWDDNNFKTNQFAHPYHGSLYYNAARSNGYNFWESIPFAFAGSFMWEYFGEVHHPSLNDWYSTAIGGINLGEGLYRLSSLVLDNTATGSNRTWREIGAFAINPARGFTRIVTGEAFRTGPNPPDRVPSHFSTTLDVGLRTVGEDQLWDSDTTDVYLQFAFDYGNPYDSPIRKPFDYFDFGIQLNFDDPVTTLGRVDTKGALWATDLDRSETSVNMIGAFAYFDYLENRAFEYGAQSLGAAFLSRFEASPFQLRTELHLTSILMGASGSDYESITGRDYDYGPGAGFRFRASLGRNGRDFFTIGHQETWLHILNGNDGNQFLSFSEVRLQVPVKEYISAGAEYILYTADRQYSDYPDVYQRSPQFRLFFSAYLGQ